MSDTGISAAIPVTTVAPATTSTVPVATKTKKLVTISYIRSLLKRSEVRYILFRYALLLQSDSADKIQTLLTELQQTAAAGWTKSLVTKREKKEYLAVLYGMLRTDVPLRSDPHLTTKILKAAEAFDVPAYGHELFGADLKHEQRLREFVRLPPNTEWGEL